MHKDGTWMALKLRNQKMSRTFNQPFSKHLLDEKYGCYIVLRKYTESKKMDAIKFYFINHKISGMSK